MPVTEITAQDRLQRFERNSQNLAAAQPEIMEAFWRLHKQTTAPAALDRKTKELIALAISVVMRCDDCIAHHVSDALNNVPITIQLRQGEDAVSLWQEVVAPDVMWHEGELICRRAYFTLPTDLRTGNYNLELQAVNESPVVFHTIAVVE